MIIHLLYIVVIQYTPLLTLPAAVFLSQPVSGFAPVNFYPCSPCVRFLAAKVGNIYELRITNYDGGVTMKVMMPSGEIRRFFWRSAKKEESRRANYGACIQRYMYFVEKSVSFEMLKSKFLVRNQKISSIFVTEKLHVIRQIQCMEAILWVSPKKKDFFTFI